MEINLRFVAFLFVLVGYSASSRAQLTITSTDASVINAVGTVITNHSDTTTLSVNIGSPGATSWDFSALKSHVSNTFTSVLPSSTPYFSSDFPGSNVVFNFTETIANNTADSWQYSTQNAGNYVMNGVVSNSVVGTDTYVLKNVSSPAQVIFPLPFTFNTQWSNNYIVTNTTYISGIPFITTSASHTKSSVVDAWGNLTMPGGAVVQALRLREDDRYSSTFPAFHFRIISYSFITKSGAAIAIVAKDTLALNSGIIQTDGVTWSSTNAVLGIHNENHLPAGYSLHQNSPNPLMQVGSIQYAIGERQFVRLKVYDDSGNEVAILVNEVKPAGSYSVNFDARQFSAGNYFYKLQAGRFSVTKKMIIIR